MNADAHAPAASEVAARIARRYLAPRWKSLGLSIASAAVFAILSGLLLGILQPAVNDLIVSPKADALRTIPLVIVVFALGRGLAQGLQALLMNSIGNGIVGDVQIELFGKLVRADLARLRASHSGESVSSVLYDASLIREAATTGLVNLIQQGLTLVAAGVVMARADWRLSRIRAARRAARCVELSAPVPEAGHQGRRKAPWRRLPASSTAIMESLDGVRVVKMENREAYEEARVAAVIAERQRHIISGDNARALAAPVSETLMMFVVAAVLAYEGWQASVGHPNAGAFTAFFAALLTAGQALRQVSNLGTVLGQGVVAGRRLFGALDVNPEVGDAPGATRATVTDATIRLNGVSFSYGDGSPVLDRVDARSQARGNRRIGWSVRCGQDAQF